MSDLPNPDAFEAVDSALAQLGLDISQAAGDEKLAQFVTDLFTTYRKGFTIEEGDA